MFCFSNCIDEAVVKHKVIYLDNETELIKNNKKLIDEFLKIHTKTGNFWHRIQVIENSEGLSSGPDCWGNRIFGLNEITEEKNKINFRELFYKAYCILNKEGYPVKYPNDYNDEREISIEIHYANSESKPVENDLVIHCDNDKYSDGDLHTLLLYIDIDCEGGELDIYDNSGYKVIKTIHPKSEDNTKTKCVLLTGNCYHYPNKVLNGKRILISYQFRSYNDNDSEHED